jgi:hypothetical protein
MAFRAGNWGSIVADVVYVSGGAVTSDSDHERSGTYKNRN